jgi:hypothetical protein
MDKYKAIESQTGTRIVPITEALISHHYAEDEEMLNELDSTDEKYNSLLVRSVPFEITPAITAIFGLHKHSDRVTVVYWQIFREVEEGILSSITSPKGQEMALTDNLIPQLGAVMQAVQLMAKEYSVEIDMQRIFAQAYDGEQEIPSFQGLVLAKPF